MDVTIGCWNVNSVNSRLEHLVKVLKEQSPEIMLLQELKCIDEKFPREAIEECGYNIAVKGQKSYNGVAILSKSPLEDIRMDLPGDEESAQARFIEAVTTYNGKCLRVISVYVPNGQDIKSDKFQYKMKFFKHLYDHLKLLLNNNEAIIIGGDFNVAPENIDVYNPKLLEGSIGFHMDERTWFRRFQSLSYQDSFRLINPESQEFSWWDYRSGGWQNNRGMRIDNILVSPEAADILKDAWIEKTPRSWEKPSDHTTIYAKLGI